MNIRQYIMENCEVDPFLHPILVEFNKLGFQTIYSCSGLGVEHRKRNISGYIMFKITSSFQQRVIERAAQYAKPNRFYIEQNRHPRYGNVLIVRDVELSNLAKRSISDRNLERSWLSFFDNVKNNIRF